MDIRLKRAYEEPKPSDGYRILVDRLWPRGLSKENAKIDYWLKNIAPSTELRTWFNHDPAKWNEFKIKYEHELNGNSDALAFVRDKLSDQTVTLVYGAKDIEHNHALVIRDIVNKKKIGFLYTLFGYLN